MGARVQRQRVLPKYAGRRVGEWKSWAGPLHAAAGQNFVTHSGVGLVTNKTHAYTRRRPGQVWVRPVGVKLNPHLHPSGLKPTDQWNPNPNCHP
jgi:hypothetical protein